MYKGFDHCSSDSSQDSSQVKAPPASREPRESHPCRKGGKYVAKSESLCQAAKKTHGFVWLACLKNQEHHHFLFYKDDKNARKPSDFCWAQTIFETQICWPLISYCSCCPGDLSIWVESATAGAFSRNLRAKGRDERKG